MFESKIKSLGEIWEDLLKAENHITANFNAFNKRRMSNRLKKTYDIDEKVIEKYNEDLNHIIKINELINELNELSFAHYLIDRNVLDFSKKLKEV